MNAWYVRCLVYFGVAILCFVPFLAFLSMKLKCFAKQAVRVFWLIRPSMGGRAAERAAGGRLLYSYGVCRECHHAVRTILTESSRTARKVPQIVYKKAPRSVRYSVGSTTTSLTRHLLSRLHAHLRAHGTTDQPTTHFVGQRMGSRRATRPFAPSRVSS